MYTPNNVFGVSRTVKRADLLRPVCLFEFLSGRAGRQAGQDLGGPRRHRGGVEVHVPPPAL